MPSIDEDYKDPNDDEYTYRKKVATIIDNGDKSMLPVDEDQEAIIAKTATGFQ